MFVRNIVFPCDFVVMDILEDTHTPIILGRPCLDTDGRDICEVREVVIRGW